MLLIWKNIEKMRSLSILLVMLIYVKFYSQNYRVFFDLTYKPNTVDTTKIKELQVLIFNKENSSFQKYKTLQSDSLFAKTVSLETDLNAYDLPFIISQNFSENTIQFKSIMIDSYKYTEKMNLNWQLENQSLTILNTSCQKATVEYGGRKWIAWFSKDYPFSTGPYKFFGLPGLILKLYDSNEDYIWQAKAIVKQEDDNLYDKNYFELQGLKTLHIKKKDFIKIYEDYKLFPMGNVLQHFPQADGLEIKRMKEIEQQMAEKYKYYNNKIELE